MAEKKARQLKNTKDVKRDLGEMYFKALITGEGR